MNYVQCFDRCNFAAKLIYLFFIGVIMQELNMMEVDAVSGGRIIGDSLIGWLVGKVADGVVSWTANQNQGGSPNGTDAMGNNW